MFTIMTKNTVNGDTLRSQFNALLQNYEKVLGLTGAWYVKQFLHYCTIISDNKCSTKLCLYRIITMAKCIMCTRHTIIIVMSCPTPPDIHWTDIFLIFIWVWVTKLTHSILYNYGTIHYQVDND